MERPPIRGVLLPHPRSTGSPGTSDDSTRESNANDPPSEHRAILRFGTDPRRTDQDGVDRDRDPACAHNGADVLIGALRRTLHACLEDVQRMASVQALARSAAAPRSPENVLTQHPRILGVESNRHATCSYTQSDMRLIPSRSSQSEEMRSRVSPSISSTPSGVPDFRDLARFEWKIRQPSRRDSQCVPN